MGLSRSPEMEPNIGSGNSHDGEDDEPWYDDGPSSDKPSSPHPESEIMGNRFHIIGYREGLMEGKEASAQEGFNAGFSESVGAGFKWGCVRGVTGALASLPGELREKIIESEQVQNKFCKLHELVNSLSTADARRMFHGDLSGRVVGEELNDDPGCSSSRLDLQAQSSNGGGLLDKCYVELQSLILESSALKMQSKILQP